MANGFHAPEGEWQRIEAPLRRLDARLESFAAAQGIALTRNQRNWPDRSLAWGDRVDRLIQIFLSDGTTLTYNLWVCASEDPGGKRFWRHEFLKEAVSIDELDEGLAGLLEHARHMVEGWDNDDLDLASNVRLDR